jgi:hypothetical protein
MRQHNEMATLAIRPRHTFRALGLCRLNRGERLGVIEIVTMWPMWSCRALKPIGGSGALSIWAAQTPAIAPPLHNGCRGSRGVYTLVLSPFFVLA